MKLVRMEYKNLAWQAVLGSAAIAKGLNTVERESDCVGIVAVWIKPVPGERGLNSLEAAPGGANFYPIATRLARSSHNRNICLILVVATLAEVVWAFHHIQMPEFTELFRPAMSPDHTARSFKTHPCSWPNVNVDFGKLGTGP